MRLEYGSGTQSTRDPTHCSSICSISLLRLLMSRFCLRALAFNGLSSSKSSSSSWDASKFAFFDWIRNDVVNKMTWESHGENTPTSGTNGDGSSFRLSACQSIELNHTCC